MIERIRLGDDDIYLDGTKVTRMYRISFRSFRLILGRDTQILFLNWWWV